MAAAQAKTPVIVWTELAVVDMDAAWDYLAREASPSVADRIGERIFKQVDRLLLFPHQGRPGRAIGTRELVFTDLPYVAVYEIYGAEIVIQRVLHQAQNWPQKH